MPLQWAAASDPGLRRSSNEDSVCARPDLSLWIVADGMGGHVAGEVASREAVQAIEAFIAETAHADADYTWPFAFEPSLSMTANRLKGGIRVANRRLSALMREDSALKGMATTASALVVDGSRGILAHVGDSRAYLCRDGQLRRLTQDHSWVEEQVRAGIMSASTARAHPWRNVVTRALAGGDDPDVDIVEVPLEAGDRLLLCSDGLMAAVTDERIGEIVAGDATPDEVCRVLVAAANQGGGPDNITVIVVQVDAA